MQQYPTPEIGTTIVRHGITLTMTEDGWRAELQHSMMRRCRDWDYCKPWIYLVTIGCQQHKDAPMPIGIGNDEECLPLPEGWTYPSWLKGLYDKPGRPHLFGELAGKSADEAHIEVNAFGKAVDALIMSIPRSYPQIRILERIVMPNHIHIVLRIKERMPEKTPLGIVMNKFKSWVNRSYKQIALGLPASTLMDLSYQKAGTGAGSPQSKTVLSSALGAVGYTQSKTVPSSALGAVRYTQSKTERTGHGSKNPKIGLVFEPGFHDRILFREGQLQRMIDYCRNNPRRLWQQRNNRQYFERLMNVRITMPFLSSGGTKGQRRWMGETSELLKPAEYGTDADGNATMTVTFNVMGNRNLLTVPERMQIQCSRSATEEEIRMLGDDVLEACNHGVVPVSPCISQGEKVVARKVLEAGKPLIVIFPNGIPQDMKNKAGFGQYFDACAEGQLLILSPWEYNDVHRTLKRWQCLFLNDIAAQVSLGAEGIA